MSLSDQSVWRHANQYSADSACAHCEGIVSHESWCSVKNARVRYAFQVALHPDHLTAQRYSDSACLRSALERP